MVSSLRTFLPSAPSVAVACAGQVQHPELVAYLVLGEVHDDVIALGDPLLVELVQRHGTRQEVPVVGDLVMGTAFPAASHMATLK